MTIHHEHPFADPEVDHARRFRGRLGGQVSLWTASAGGRRAGLTISSLVVAAGEPTQVIGLLDPDSDLAHLLSAPVDAAPGNDTAPGKAAAPGNAELPAEEGAARAVVQLLEWRHRDLAEQFAGRLPAPGGPFARAEWVPTPAGPRLADAESWLEVTVTDRRAVGWSLAVTARVDALVVGAEDDPLLHRRGRYGRSPTGGRG